MSTEPTDRVPEARDIPQEDTHITQSFRDQRQIESFLRGNKLLKLIEHTADIHIKTFQQTKKPEDALAAVIVRLPFFYGDLRQQSPELLHLVVGEPVQFLDALKYSVYAIVRELVKQRAAESGLKSIDIDQVHVQLRFIGLPLQKNLLFDPSRNRYTKRLSLVFGVLSAFTEPEPTTVQSVWFCSRGCTRNRIKSETSEVPFCSSCTRPMSEYTKLRRTQKYSLLRILPAASVETPRTVNKIFRAILVRVKDHVHDCELALGSRYLITGFYDYYSNSQEFQAWNLIKH